MYHRPKSWNQDFLVDCENEEPDSRRWLTFINAAVILPACRKSRDSRPKWRFVRNPSSHFRYVAAPWCVVARDLIKASIEADVLDGQFASGATDVGDITTELLEDWATV